MTLCAARISQVDPHDRMIKGQQLPKPRQPRVPVAIPPGTGHYGHSWTSSLMRWDTERGALDNRADPRRGDRLAPQRMYQVRI
jgi:hypothetical protein